MTPDEMTPERGQETPLTDAVWSPGFSGGQRYYQNLNYDVAYELSCDLERRLRTAEEQIRFWKKQVDEANQTLGDAIERTEAAERHLAARQTEWVAVETKLPERDVDVWAWVIYKDGDPHGSQSWVDADGIWALSGYQKEVTHWMPLPVAPKKEGQ